MSIASTKYLARERLTIITSVSPKITCFLVFFLNNATPEFPSSGRVLPNCSLSFHLSYHVRNENNHMSSIYYHLPMKPIMSSIYHHVHNENTTSRAYIILHAMKTIMSSIYHHIRMKTSHIEHIPSHTQRKHHTSSTYETLFFLPTQPPLLTCLASNLQLRVMVKVGKWSRQGNGLHGVHNNNSLEKCSTRGL